MTINRQMNKRNQETENDLLNDELTNKIQSLKVF